MKFVANKPPVVQNSQRTYKRSLNLHFAIIAVSIAAVASRWGCDPDRSVRGGCYLLGSFDKGAVFKTARSREGAGFA